MPQSLNRYGATSVGQVGVAQGAVNSGYNPTGEIVGLAKTLAIGYPLDRLGQSITVLTGYQFAGEATYRIRGLNRPLTLHTSIRRGNLWQRFGLGKQFKNILQREAEIEARITATRLSLKSTDINLTQLVQYEGTPILTALDDLRVGGIIKGVFGFGVDALIAGGFEAYDIWDDPFYTTEQKRRRVGVVGVTNALGSAAGAGIAGLVCTSPLAPGCIGLAFVFGTVGALTSDALLTEPFSQVFVGPRERKLKPLIQ